MSDLRASASVRSLIETAKSDGPDSGSRARVWSSVCRCVTPTVAPAGAKSALSGAGGGKSVSLGALFGGAVTVGLATAVLIVQPLRSQGLPSGGRLAFPSASPRVAIAEQSEDARPMRAEVKIERLPTVSANVPAAQLGSGDGPVSATGAGTAASETGTRAASGESAVRAATSETPLVAATGAVSDTSPTPASHRPVRPASGSSNRIAYDPLAREASLLTQARAALAQADPRTALRAVRAAMAVPGRQLVPEELSVESQALRALGRPRDADALTTELRARYPDSALAR